MKCEKHTSYKGVNKPKADCTACWSVYIEKHFFEHKEAMKAVKKLLSCNSKDEETCVYQNVEITIEQK